MKHGVLLLNFGGPETLKDVKPFLFRLFSDPSILVGIPTPFRQGVALLIALMKGPASVRCYAAIGGGSPQLKWTKIQGEGLEKRLNENAGAGVTQGKHQDSYKVALGMRSGSPEIREGLKELKDWGAQTLTLLPLFPQYSTTTSGSCLKEAYRQLRKIDWRPLRVIEVASWPDQSSYIAALRGSVTRSLEQARKGHDDEPYLVFSAHSLPIKIVERGDPYPQEVQRTVEAAARGLKTQWSLAFQSRNGSLPWLEPYLENELERLGREGKKNVVVCPVSFVSDHIETLWELDRLYAEQAKDHGIEAYTRVPAFNDDERFIEVLVEVLVDVFGDRKEKTL